MKRTDNFHKFVKQPKGSAIKEQIRQEKKKGKKERAAAIEAHFARKREERALHSGNPIQNTKGTKGFNPKKADPKAATGKTPFKSANGKVASARPAEQKATPQQPAKTFLQKKAALPKNKGYHPKVANTTEPAELKVINETAKPTQKAAEPQQTRKVPAKTFQQKKESLAKNKGYNPKVSPNTTPASAQETGETRKPETRSFQDKKGAITKKTAVTKPGSFESKAAAIAAEQMPLNKFIAHSGICSRRDAAILVKDGKVTVNDEVATDPGTKVAEYDVVKVQGKKITPSKNFVYILLNKPKDFITTVEDPQGRRTVLDLVKHATAERVYPVGRLDRNTSGVLLLTNDGDLAQKLSHPKHEIKKVYEVKLDRNLTKGDLDKIASGITLEDGFVAPDVVAYADSKDKSIIGIEIHSGRNRIVRRIFEHLKYDVKALDRVMYAGLTKKNVQRGNWRFLSEKEVRLLKFMNQSFVKVKKED